MVKVHMVTLLIIDHDSLGAEGVKEVIQETHYPNHCIAPSVLKIDTCEVEWSDDHALNRRDRQMSEVERLFENGQTILTCFTTGPCRIPSGHASCDVCGSPRAYVNPASYAGRAELGDVLVDGVPMRTIHDYSAPMGVVTVWARRGPGPITDDNMVRTTYHLPGYGQSVVTTTALGVAPGVDMATNTFTCPKCQASRDCQALNPKCLSCGYQDPRRFEVPGDRP